MMNPRKMLPVAAITALGVLSIGCEDKPSKPLAPTASALARAKPASQEAAKMAVQTSSSKVTFMMDAPLEKIIGKAPKSMTGEVHLDPNDIEKSSGLVKMDLFELEIFQQNRKDEKAEFGEQKKEDTQNQHARTWLEIGEDAPKDKREKYRMVEFKVTKIKAKGPKNIAEMKGAERELTVTVTGDFRLHGRKTTKTADMKVTVKYDGDKPVSAHFVTVKPFSVGLDEHDVRPREAFGKLAAKTLEALAPKVAKQAEVRLDFTAKVGK